MRPDGERFMVRFTRNKKEKCVYFDMLEEALQFERVAVESRK